MTWKLIMWHLTFCHIQNSLFKESGAIFPLILHLKTFRFLRLISPSSSYCFDIQILAGEVWAVNNFTNSVNWFWSWHYWQIGQYIIERSRKFTKWENNWAINFGLKSMRYIWWPSFHCSVVWSFRTRSIQRNENLCCFFGSFRFSLFNLVGKFL